jgi:hypothetical protein
MGFGNTIRKCLWKTLGIMPATLISFVNNPVDNDVDLGGDNPYQLTCL